MSLVSSQSRTFPTHWEVLAFEDAFVDMTGGNAKIQTRDYKREGLLPIIDQGLTAVAGYIDELALACKAPLPCILFGDHTRIFKYAEHSFALGADGVKVLVPRPGLDARFAYQYLKTVRLPVDLGYSRHFRHLREARIPRPPIAEQRRIADILDKADAIRRKRKEAIALTEELLRSAFLEMFGDPVTNPMSWEMKPLGEVAMLFAGNSLPPGVAFTGQRDGYLLMKVGDMNSPGNEVELVAAREWAAKVPSASVVAPAGAVVIPKRGGAIATNKKRVLTRPAALDPNLMAVAPRSSLRLDYLRQWFEGIDLSNLSNGSAVPQLNKKDLAPLTLPVPSQQVQARFADCAKRIRALRRRDEDALNDADDLFAALTAEAFSQRAEDPC